MSAGRAGPSAAWAGLLSKARLCRHPPGPPLPVVAVISERCEVLLQLPVRLLEPLAQVLELAAERGLEGRVLGVHARAAPARAGRRCPREPWRPLLPPLRPLYRFLRTLSLASCGDRGCRRGGTEGEVGGGAEEGGARRTQGASATTLGGGPREGGRGWRSPPHRGGPEEGRAPRPSATAQRGGRRRGRAGGSGAQHKVVCSPGQKRKGPPLLLLLLGKGRNWTGGQKGKWGLGADLEPSRWEGQRVARGLAFSTTDSSRNAFPSSWVPPYLMQKHFKRHPSRLCLNEYLLMIKKCVQMRCLSPYVLKPPKIIKSGQRPLQTKHNTSVSDETHKSTRPPWDYLPKDGVIASCEFPQ